MENTDKEFDEINEVYQKVGAATQKMAKPLLEEAKFQKSELRKLRKIIKEQGWTASYWNGHSQRGTIESAEAKTYHKLIKDFNSTIKNLHSILDGKAPEPEDDFMKAVKQ